MGGAGSSCAAPRKRMPTFGAPWYHVIRVPNLIHLLCWLEYPCFAVRGVWSRRVARVVLSISFSVFLWITLFL